MAPRRSESGPSVVVASTVRRTLLHSTRPALSSQFGDVLRLSWASKAPRSAAPFRTGRPPKGETMEGQAMLISLSLLSGIVAGSRAFTAPAAVSWAALLGDLNLAGSWLAFMG